MGNGKLGIQMKLQPACHPSPSGYRSMHTWNLKIRENSILRGKKLAQIDKSLLIRIYFYGNNHKKIRQNENPLESTHALLLSYSSGTTPVFPASSQVRRCSEFPRKGPSRCRWLMKCRFILYLIFIL